jgi:outer membrane protein assembly factor BamB
MLRQFREIEGRVIPHTSLLTPLGSNKAKLFLGALLLIPAIPAHPQNVLTQHNDSLRTGANLHETQLTPASVKTNFGKLFSLPVDGQIYAQPLIVNGVDIPGKGVRNVVYVATMANTVYAFDADKPEQDCPIWKKNLGTPVPYELIPWNWGTVAHQYNIKPLIGITSTPVIDPVAGLIWVTVKTMLSRDDLRYYLYSLNIKTGDIVASSKPIESGEGKDKLQAQTALQRPGLLLANGMVYAAFGSHQDGGYYHGWLVAFDAETLVQKYVFCVTPGDEEGEGGIWQAGNGPAADSDGYIYIMTGNGKFEPDRRYGSSFVKLNSRLEVVDWFTPSNYARLSHDDIDLGSSGPMLLPDSDQLVGGGKQGWFYLLERNHLGKLQPKHSVAPALQYFHVSSHWTLDWISWLLPVFGYHHIHGAPVYWKSAQSGPLVFVWPEETKLKGYEYDPASHFQTKPAVVGPKAPPGMPGGFLSISANGAQDGLLWASIPRSKDALAAVVPGVLRVFDANTLEELWSTDKKGSEELFDFAKFCPPTVANGKVYLATFSDKLNVYGLLPTPTALPPWTKTGKRPKKEHGHGRMRM